MQDGLVIGDPQQGVCQIALVEWHKATGGVMSDERAEIVAAKAARMVQAMAECGCTLNNAYMPISLLALVAIPELRISVWALWT